MGIKKFWQDMSYRIGLKTTDKLLIGNIDTSEADYVDVGDVIKLFTTDDLVAGTETKQFTAALKVKVDNLPANTITELAAKISQAEADARHTLLLTGSDAFVHAQRGLADGFTTENHVKLDNTIDDNVGVPFLWTPHSKGLNKLGSFQPDSEIGDFSFNRSVTLDYTDKKGLAKTAAINEPVFDWINGKPYAIIQHNTTNVKTNDVLLNQVLPSVKGVFEINAFVKDIIGGDNRFVLMSINTNARIELVLDSTAGDVSLYLFSDNGISNTIARTRYDLDTQVDNVYQVLWEENNVQLIVNGITVIGFKNFSAPLAEYLDVVNMKDSSGSSVFAVGKVAVYSDIETAVNKNRFKTFAEMAAFANYNKPRN